METLYIKATYLDNQTNELIRTFVTTNKTIPLGVPPQVEGFKLGYQYISEKEYESFIKENSHAPQTP